MTGLGLRTDRGSFMRMVPTYIWPTLTGVDLERLSQRQAFHSGRDGHRMGKHYGLPFKTQKQPQVQFGRHLPMESISIRCCLAGTTRPRNVAGIGRQTGNITYSSPIAAGVISGVSKRSTAYLERLRASRLD